jgi:hypothetical protein
MMGFSSEDKKKKPYSDPTITKLTLEQAKRILSSPISRNDQEAAALLDLLRRREHRQHEEKCPPNEALHNPRKRSA